MDPYEQNVARAVNERIAQQIGQLIISLTEANVRAQSDAARIAALDAENQQLKTAAVAPPAPMPPAPEPAEPPPVEAPKVDPPTD